MPSHAGRWMFSLRFRSFAPATGFWARCLVLKKSHGAPGRFGDRILQSRVVPQLARAELSLSFLPGMGVSGRDRERGSDDGGSRGR